ncbi:MAG: response regulator [Gemmatimonadaceae bacterium]|jgi:two-component system cell cycle response regulator DivK
MTLRVLVVEDVQLNLELITEVLETAGHVVYAAGTAAAGIAQARAVMPDVVLMDIRLPDMDGIEATKRLRSDPALAGLAIIALTAQAMRGDAESALAAGCDAYISKPIDVRTIAADISCVVTRRHTTAKRQREDRETTERQ